MGSSIFKYVPIFLFHLFSIQQNEHQSKNYIGTLLYKVNGFDNIEVKVNPKTMEIQSGKSKLEEHNGQKELDVKELICDGVLYNLKSEININNEITATIECDVEIKEEPIESKDLQETEDPLQIPSASDNFDYKFKIETIESGENNIKIEPNSYNSELEKEDSLAAIHDGKKPFKCNFCEANFNHKHHLKKHIKVHEAGHEGKKPFKCNVCDTRFAKNITMKAHILTIHENKSGEKIFQCSHCDSQFKYNRSLTYHISHVHGGKKPVFKCDQCTKQYHHKSHLNKHIVKVHNGKKSFEYNLKCDPCDKVFSRRSELKLHIDKVHEGKQSFICVICSKQYKQAYTLKMHYKTLHGENDQVQGNLSKGINDKTVRR